MQTPCVGSTNVYRYRRSYGWRHAHRQLAFSGVRPQLGQNWRTMVRFVALKAFVQWENRMGVIREVEPARMHFRQTAGSGLRTYIATDGRTAGAMPTDSWPFLVCVPNWGRTGGPWPDLPHLKHSFNGQIVWGWLVKSNPRGYTSGKPRGLRRCRPRGLLSCPVSHVPGGTDRSWGRCAPARRWRALPRHLKPLPCMRCRRRRRRWRRPSWRIPQTRPCPPLPSTP